MESTEDFDKKYEEFYNGVHQTYRKGVTKDIFNHINELLEKHETLVLNPEYLSYMFKKDEDDFLFVSMEFDYPNKIYSLKEEQLNKDEAKKIADKYYLSNAFKNTFKENPLDSIVDAYEKSESKKSAILLIDAHSIETIKSILPTYLNIRVEESNYFDNLKHIVFDNNESLPDSSEFNNPKDTIEYYLENHNINYSNISIKDLEKAQKHLDNIKLNFIDKILEDTNYLTTKTLFYMQPLSDWKKSEVNNLVSSLKKIKDDFKYLDNLTVIMNSDDLYENILHNAVLDKEANNLRSFSHAVELIEDKFNYTKKFIEEIKNIKSNFKDDSTEKESFNSINKKINKNR